MLIYRDIFTDDELSSDTFPTTVVDDVVIEFKGKFVVRKEDDVKLEGANASAEELEEAMEQNVQKGVDIVLNHQLVKMDIYENAKQFKDYIKTYMKKLADRLKADGSSDEEVTAWKTKMQNWVGALIKKERFKNLEFYQGPSEEAADGQLAILEYRDVNGVEVPTVMLVKAGVVEEKC